MSESFDPYHKWLQIPSAEQPPHHYRLLGLAVFEADRDVIASAADQRIGHIRTYQTGKHSELSQKILNELASAQVCLLNAEKKAAYDAALRARLASAQQPPPRTRILPQAVPLATATPQPAAAAFEPVVPPVLRRKQKSSGNRTVLIGLGGVAVAAVAIAAILLTRGSKPVAESSASAPKEPAQVAATSEVKEPPIEDTAKPQPAPRKSTPTAIPNKGKQTEPTPAANTDKTPGAEAKPIETPPTKAQTGDTKPEASQEMPADNHPSGETADTRIAVPDLIDAIRSVQEVFGQELKEARTPSQRVDVSRKLREAAVNSPEESADWYALMDEARHQAAAAGDAEAALRTLNEMLGRFVLDPLAEREKTLREVSKAPGLAAKDLVPVNKSLAEHALALADDAVSADNFPIMSAALDIASAAARKTKDTALIKTVNLRTRETELLAKNYQSIAAAQQVLEQDRQDPAANLTVGKYLCFTKGNWRRGLPLIALSGDKVLQPLAEQELSDHPDAVKFGDAWWAAADKEPATVKSHIQAHAASWYRQDLPDLGGLEKARIEKRIAAAPDIKDEVVTSTGESRQIAPSREKPRSNINESTIIGRWTVVSSNANMAQQFTADFFPNGTFAIDGQVLANFTWKGRGKSLFDVSSPYIQGSATVSKDDLLGSFRHKTEGQLEWRGMRVVDQPKKSKTKSLLQGKWELTIYKRDGSIFSQPTLEFLPDGTFWNVSKNLREPSFHWKDLGNGEFDYITGWERGTLKVSAKQFIGIIHTSDGPMQYVGKRVGDSP